MLDFELSEHRSHVVLLQAGGFYIISFRPIEAFPCLRFTVWPWTALSLQTVSGENLFDL